MLRKGFLRRNVYHPAFEEGIELLDVLHIVLLIGQHTVVINIEGLDVSFGLDDIAHIVFYWLVQQSVADKVHEVVGIHSCLVLREELGVFGDEGDDVVHLLLWRLEAALAVLRDNELVSFHTAAFAVQPHIRRIAQAITSVEVIACVSQHVLNINACLEVVVCELVRHC